MNRSVHSSPRRLLAPTLLLLAAACGNRAAPNPNDREIPWTYGPQTGGATAEHVRGTGTKGGAAMAKGWQCRLLDGKRLVVRPFQLADSHPLFDKVVLSLNLFDAQSQPIETLSSGPVTAQNATFTFELSAATAKRLHDLVLYYVAR